MRPIARQSVRLASRSRARAPSHSRQLSHQLPSPQQVRSFSQSAQRRSDNRPPPAPSEHQAAFQQREEGHKPREDGVSHAASKEAGASETTTGDESQKQRVGMTKRQRRKEAQTPTIPKPPPIPDWFLSHNVKLHVERAKPDRHAKNAQVLRCVDNETGHTLFTLPYYEAWPVPGLPARTSDGGNGDKDTTLAQQKSPGQSFFDSKRWDSPDAPPPTSKPQGSTIITPPSDDVYSDINPHALLRWSVLQAEMGIRAAFAVARDAPHLSSQAGSRVDIALHCRDSESHANLDELVEDLAAITSADLIRLDANDFAELTADYVGKGSDAPGSFSNLAYDVYNRFAPPSGRSDRIIEDEEEDDMDEDEVDEEEIEDSQSGWGGRWSKTDAMGFTGLSSLQRRLMDVATGMRQSPGRLEVDISVPLERSGDRFARAQSSGGPEYDEAKLSALLDDLLEAPGLKRKSTLTESSETLRRLGTHLGRASLSNSSSGPSDQAMWRMWRSNPGCWLPDVSGLLAASVNRAGNESGEKKHNIKLEACDEREADGSTFASTIKRTIIHVRDLREICHNRLGETIVRRLVNVVQKRRRAGHEVVLVGTSAADRFPFIGDIQGLNEFREIRVPAVFDLSKEDQALFKSSTDRTWATGPPNSRILEMNLRHIRRMLETLRPGTAIDLFSESAQRQLALGGYDLDRKPLSFERTQALVLTAIGLSQSHAISSSVNAGHIGLASHIEWQAAKTANDCFDNKNVRRMDKLSSDLKGKSEGDAPTDKGQSRLEKLKQNSNTHETRLFPGVVDPQNIKTGFNQVHAPPETIDALKTLTSLSLQRPDAFKYGVLAADRLPGLLLYGPPGTGKTLLAKAVAKESGATVLEISGAQIYEKYVGEGEKMVRAVFSLAKKLSPCIVFIDEADAIFGSRSNAGNRNTHREIINQFLREWDGMDLHNVFIMVASNRPFDLDDAVLRRLPRRLLVDLPVAKDRESILKIHLSDEALDESVNLSQLAEDTPLYSGSDLKNLCVSAALACVREENELAESKKDDKEFKLPEKRILAGRHFEKAIKDISASISEDMSSLTAIKKFDEQFGDRRGRKKKTSYGFGIGDIAVDESAARVRSEPPPP